MAATIVTGDGASIRVTLRKDGAVFAIDPGATVQASIITTDHNTVIVSPVSVIQATTGSDWANSVVVVVFSEAATAQVLDYIPTNKTSMTVVIEVQVDDGVNDVVKRTWFITAIAVKGTIP